MRCHDGIRYHRLPSSNTTRTSNRNLRGPTSPHRLHGANNDDQRLPTKQRFANFPERRRPQPGTGNRSTHIPDRRFFRTRPFPDGVQFGVLGAFTCHYRPSGALAKNRAIACSYAIGRRRRQRKSRPGRSRAQGRALGDPATTARDLTVADARGGRRPLAAGCPRPSGLASALAGLCARAALS